LDIERARNPNGILCYTDDFYIPAQRVELKKKKLPFFIFPAAWNNAPGGKLNPRQHLYLKELKNQEQRSKQQHKRSQPHKINK
jgi:hypothetical protein